MAIFNSKIFNSRIFNVARAAGILIGDSARTWKRENAYVTGVGNAIYSYMGIGRARIMFEAILKPTREAYPIHRRIKASGDFAAMNFNSGKVVIDMSRRKRQEEKMILEILMGN